MILLTYQKLAKVTAVIMHRSQFFKRYGYNNMSMINFKENLKSLRKEIALSQDELANKLGITSQAVSKWECGLSYPDITLLIPLADLFGVTVDELLRGKHNTDHNKAGCTDLSDIQDDGKLRVVQFFGKKILKSDDYDPDVKIPLLIDQCDNQEKAVNVELWGSANIEGGINGGVVAGDYVFCKEGINGSVVAGGAVTCEEGINGGVNAGGSVTCGDEINGNINAREYVKCAGNIEGSLNVLGNVECNGDIGGNVEAESGSVSCDGNIGGTVTCKIINGDVNAEGDVFCDEINGNITSEGNGV